MAYPEQPNLNELIYSNIKSTAPNSVTLKNNVLLTKSDRILDLSNDLKESLRDKVGAFLFIKDRFTSEVKFITNDFWLTAMQIAFKERVQITESFNSSNFSFFGDNARVYNFTAATVDSTSSDPYDPGKLYYQSSILELYKNHLRGTKLVENNYIAVLCVANHLIEGYPINLNVGYSADAAPMTQFSIAWLVTSHYYDMEGVVNKARLEKMYSVTSRDLPNVKILQDDIALLSTALAVDGVYVVDYFNSLKSLKDKTSKYQIYVNRVNSDLAKFTETKSEEVLTNETFLSPAVYYRYNRPEDKQAFDLKLNEAVTKIQTLIMERKRSIEEEYIKDSKLLYGIAP